MQTGGQINLILGQPSVLDKNLAVAFVLLDSVLNFKKL